MPRRTCAPWIRGIESDSTVPTSLAWPASASLCPTCRSTSDREGLSDPAIGIVSTLAALTSLAQFPVGLWSDRLGSRKPFLVVALAVVAVSSWLLRGAEGTIWVGLLVILFAENGIGRAVVESLSGAEAAALAPKGGVGAALGALRFWKPIGIVLVALVGSWMSERYGVGAILLPLAVVQSLAVVAALLIHEPETRATQRALTNGDLCRRSTRVSSGKPQPDGLRRTPGSGPSSRQWSCSTRRTHLGASISGFFSSETSTPRNGCSPTPSS